MVADIAGIAEIAVARLHRAPTMTAMAFRTIRTAARTTRIATEAKVRLANTAIRECGGATKVAVRRFPNQPYRALRACLRP